MHCSFFLFCFLDVSAHFTYTEAKFMTETFISSCPAANMHIVDLDNTPSHLTLNSVVCIDPHRKQFEPIM